MKLTGRGEGPFTGAMFRSMLGPAVLSSLGLAFGDAADAVVVGQRMGATGLAAGPGAAGVHGDERICPRLWKRGLRVLCRLMGEGRGEEAVRNFRQVIQAALAVSVLLGAAGAALFGPFLWLLGTTPSGRCGVCGL